MSFSSILRGARNVAKEKKSKRPGYYVRKLGRSLSAVEAEVAICDKRPCNAAMIAYEKGQDIFSPEHKWYCWWNHSKGATFSDLYNTMWELAVKKEARRRRREKEQFETNSR